MATEEQKRHRLQKSKSSFDFFDDDDDYRVEAVTKSAARLEQQIQLHQNKQLEIASNLAANLQSDQAIPLGSNKQETSSDDNVIKEELAILGKELENSKAEIADLKQNSLARIDLDRQFVTGDDLQYHVKSTEQRVAQIRADFQKDCQANRDVTDQHTIRLDDLNVHLEERERHVRGLAEKSEDQETTIELLDALVRGNSDNNDPGLKAQFMLDSARLSAVQAQTQKTESGMQQLAEKVSQMHMPQSSDYDPTWGKDLDTLRQELNGLHQSYDSHVETYKAEFDFLASDMDRLDEQGKKHAKEIEDLERSQAERIESLKQLLSTTTRPQPPPTPPLTNIPFIPDELYQRKLKDLETKLHRLAESQKGLDQFKERFATNLNHLSNRISAVDDISTAQQQKFDGLTTEHLFTSIVNHMHNMYPNIPVNIAARLNDVVSRQHAFENFLGGMTQRLNQADLRLNQAEQRHAALHTHSAETAKVLNDMKLELAALKDVALDKEGRDRVYQLGETIESLEQRLESLKAESSADIEKYSTTIAALRSDIAVLKERPQVAMATMEDLRRRTSTARDESSSDSDEQLSNRRKRARI